MSLSQWSARWLNDILPYAVKCRYDILPCARRTALTQWAFWWRCDRGLTLGQVQHSLMKDFQKDLWRFWITPFRMTLKASSPLVCFVNPSPIRMSCFCPASMSYDLTFYYAYIYSLLKVKLLVSLLSFRILLSIRSLAWRNVHQMKKKKWCLYFHIWICWISHWHIVLSLVFCLCT